MLAFTTWRVFLQKGFHQQTWRRSTRTKHPPNIIPKTATLANGAHVTLEAIKNWRKLAEKPGNKAKQLEAANSLLECYRNGICIDKDEKEAHKYEKKAAMLGDAIPQYNLSVK